MWENEILRLIKHSSLTCHARKGHRGKEETAGARVGGHFLDVKGYQPRFSSPTAWFSSHERQCGKRHYRYAQRKRRRETISRCASGEESYKKLRKPRTRIEYVGIERVERVIKSSHRRTRRYVAACQSFRTVMFSILL